MVCNSNVGLSGSNCVGTVCEGNVVVAVGVTSRNGVGACIGALSLGERYYLRQSLTAHKLQRTFGVAHRERNKVFAVHACFVVDNYRHGTLRYCVCVCGIDKGYLVVVVFASTRDVVITDVACTCSVCGQSVNGAVCFKYATFCNRCGEVCNVIAVKAACRVYRYRNFTFGNCVGAVCEVYGVVAVHAFASDGVRSCVCSDGFFESNDICKTFAVCNVVSCRCGEFCKRIAVHA